MGAFRRAERLVVTHPEGPEQPPRRTRKGSTNQLPEVPSASLTLPFGKVDRRGKRIVSIRIGPNTLFASTAYRPGQGSRSAASPLSHRASCPRKDPRPARQMPLANHLQPTSCHVHPTGHPDSRLEGSHLATRRTSVMLLSGWAACFHVTSPRRGQLAITGITSPGWPMGWYPTDQPRSLHHPTWDTRCPE